jgi:hypothetical protein
MPCSKLAKSLEQVASMKLLLELSKLKGLPVYHRFDLVGLDRSVLKKGSIGFKERLSRSTYYGLELQPRSNTDASYHSKLLEDL